MRIKDFVRALDLVTGEVVAVKRIQIGDNQEIDQDIMVRFYI